MHEDAVGDDLSLWEKEIKTELRFKSKNKNNEVFEDGYLNGF